MPVIPGIFGHNADLALAEIAVCQAAGASAALVAPPSYYPLAPAEQLAFFARVAEASPLPLVLYNIPPYTKVSIAPAVVAELAAMKQVLAVKDSSRDFGYFLSVLDAVAAAGIAPEEFKVLTGTDSMLLSCLAAGGAGAICASANVVPELPVGICAAFAAGDLERARELERRLRRVLDICRAGSPQAGIKAAAAAARPVQGRPWSRPGPGGARPRLTRSGASSRISARFRLHCSHNPVATMLTSGDDLRHSSPIACYLVKCRKISHFYTLVTAPVTRIQSTQCGMGH